MTLHRQQIEALTQSILRELSSRGIQLTAQPAAPAEPIRRGAAGAVNSTSSSAARISPANPRPLELYQKVISEAALVAAGAAGRTIIVSPSAVMTPSGRDYIRRNDIVVTSSVAGGTLSAQGLVIVNGNAASAVSAAAAARWKTVSAGCEIDAVRRIRQHPAQRVVCCGVEASVTACLLNRDVNLRAAVVTQDTDLEKLMAVMNPQVLCLSSAWPFAAMLKLLRTLQQHGSETPAIWKESSSS